jgi:hypothetical protein
MKWVGNIYIKMFLCYSIEMADWAIDKTLDFIDVYRKYTVLCHSLDKNYKQKYGRKKRCSSGARRAQNRTTY